MLNLFNAPQCYAEIIDYAKKLISNEGKNGPVSKIERQMNQRIHNNAFCGLLRFGYPYEKTDENGIPYIRIEIDGAIYQCPESTVSNILRNEFESIIKPTDPMEEPKKEDLTPSTMRECEAVEEKSSSTQDSTPNDGFNKKEPDKTISSSKETVRDSIEVLPKKVNNELTEEKVNLTDKKEEPDMAAGANVATESIENAETTVSADENKNVQTPEPGTGENESSEHTFVPEHEEKPDDRAKPDKGEREYMKNEQKKEDRSDNHSDKKEGTRKSDHESDSNALGKDHPEPAKQKEDKKVEKPTFDKFLLQSGIPFLDDIVFDSFKPAQTIEIDISSQPDNSPSDIEPQAVPYVEDIKPESDILAELDQKPEEPAEASNNDMNASAAEEQNKPEAIETTNDTVDEKRLGKEGIDSESRVEPPEETESDQTDNAVFAAEMNEDKQDIAPMPQEELARQEEESAKTTTEKFENEGPSDDQKEWTPSGMDPGEKEQPKDVSHVMKASDMTEQTKDDTINEVSEATMTEAADNGTKAESNTPEVYSEPKDDKKEDEPQIISNEDKDSYFGEVKTETPIPENLTPSKEEDQEAIEGHNPTEDNISDDTQKQPTDAFSESEDYERKEDEISEAAEGITAAASAGRRFHARNMEQRPTEPHKEETRYQETKMKEPAAKRGGLFAPKAGSTAAAQPETPDVQFGAAPNPDTENDTPKANTKDTEQKPKKGGFLNSIFGRKGGKPKEETSKDEVPDLSALDAPAHGEAHEESGENAESKPQGMETSQAEEPRKEEIAMIQDSHNELLQEKNYAQDGGTLYVQIHRVMLRKTFGDSAVGPYRFIFWPTKILERKAGKYWGDFLVHVTDPFGNETILSTDSKIKELAARIDNKDFKIFALWVDGKFESHVALNSTTDSMFSVEEEQFNGMPDGDLTDTVLDQFRFERKGQPKHFIVPFKNNNRGELNIPIIGYVEVDGKKYMLDRREGNTLKYKYNGAEKIIRGHWEDGGFVFSVEDAIRRLWENTQ